MAPWVGHAPSIRTGRDRFVSARRACRLSCATTATPGRRRLVGALAWLLRPCHAHVIAASLGMFRFRGATHRHSSTHRKTMNQASDLPLQAVDFNDEDSNTTQNPTFD